MTVVNIGGNMLQIQEPQLVEDRIVLDLGEDRFWLVPRDLTGRTLLFTLRRAQGIQAGDHLLLPAFGAGFTWGAALCRAAS